MARTHFDVDQLSPSLRTVYESIQGLLATASRNDAKARHQVGALIANVKQAPDKYGSHAVEQLARALSSNVHTLYRCAAVAECWSPTKLEALLARTTPQGQPLSWSHLVLLAGVTSAKRRAELVDHALRDALSVRELAVLLDAPASKGSRGAGLVVLHRVVRATERWSAAVEALHGELLAELEGVSGSEGDPRGLLDSRNRRRGEAPSADAGPARATEDRTWSARAQSARR